jgi:hypothetical protein
MFGPLRAIINEDRVAASRNGFDTHSHRNIFYVVAGELELCVSFFSVPFIHRLTSFCKDPMDNGDPSTWRSSAHFRVDKLRNHYIATHPTLDGKTHLSSTLTNKV